MRNVLLNLAKMAVSAGLIAYILLTQVHLGELIELLSGAQGGYLAAAGLLMILGTALRAVRWLVLLRPLEIRVPLAKLVYMYFVGAFFNVILPTGLGGDAVKMGMLARQTGRGPEAVGATLVDRATGLWMLFVMALMSLPFSAHLLPPQALWSVGSAAALGAVGGFLVMATPLLPWIGARIKLPGQAKLERFYHSVAQLGYPALGWACLISLIFNLSLILFNVWIALSLGIQQPLGIFLLFVPIISFTLALPISVGGLGVREGAYMTLFALVGVSSASAAAMSLVNYFLTNVVVGLLGGVWYGLNSLKEAFHHA
jgi:hypothetical protein